MNFSNAVVVGVLLAGVSGCAYLPTDYLPTGYPSRTNKTPTDQLFIDTNAGSAPVESAAPAAPVSGLQIKKSKRGNMESYVVRGQRYYTLDSADGYSARGLASWYGPNFHGRTASNGEVYDMYRLTAAHKTLPLPTYARVTHVDNGREVIVKINDRGPFSGDRIIDLSFAAALRLGMVNDGTGMVDIQVLSPEEMAVISGPENKLGIEFYYAAGEAEAAETQLASNEGAAQARTPETSDALISVAAIEIDDKPITAQPINSTGADINQIGVETVASADALLTDMPVVETAMLPELADDFPVVQTASAAVELSVSTPVVDPLAANSNEQALLESALLPVIADANVQAVASVPAAVQAVKLPSDKDRSGYYIQAGVYADVADAERIAVDAVLAAPGEEVHVKPLKNSDMYRITIGPIVTSAHSVKVAELLSSAGIDNFTVKVK